MNWLTDEVFSLWTPLQIFHLKTRMSWHRYRHMKRDFRKKSSWQLKFYLYNSCQLRIERNFKETWVRKTDTPNEASLWLTVCSSMHQLLLRYTPFMLAAVGEEEQMDRFDRFTVHERWSKQSQMLSFNDRVYIDSVHQVCKIGKKRGVGLGFVRYLW